MKSPDICLGVHGDDFEGDLSCHENLTLHPNLMRLSVGCEPIEYLLSDLSELIAQDEQQRKASDNSFGWALKMYFVSRVDMLSI